MAPNLKIGFINLVQRIVGQRAFEFRDGMFILWNIPGVVLPIRSFVKLHASFRKHLGDKTTEQLLYELGKMQGEYSIKALIQKFNLTPTIATLDFYHDQAKMIGLGSLSYDDNNPQEGTINFFSKNNPFPQFYKRIKGKQKHVIDHYFKGLIAGTLEVYMDNVRGSKKVLMCEEKKCMGRGDAECIFAVSPEKSKETELKKKFETLRENIKLSMYMDQITTHESLPPIELFEWVKQRTKGKFFVYQDGYCLCFEENVLLMMLSNFAVLNYAAGVKGKKAFYETGFDEGKEIVAYFLKHFKIPKNDFPLKRAVQLVSFYGLGIASLTHASGDHVVVKLENNRFAKKYKDFFGANKGVDDFAAGLLGGIISQVRGRGVKVRESACIASGKPACLFETY